MLEPEEDRKSNDRYEPLGYKLTRINESESQQNEKFTVNIPFPKELIKKISDSQNIILMGHLMPDPDCVGALIATKEILEKIGKNVQMVLEDGVSRGFKNTLSSASNIKTSIEEARKSFVDSETKPIVILLDLATISRATHTTQNIKELENLEKVVIDHHQTNENSQNSLNYIGKEPASCEIICGLANAFNINLSDLSKESLCALYQGIMADTRRLNPQTTPKETIKLAGVIEDICGKYVLDKFNLDLYAASRIDGLMEIRRNHTSILNKKYQIVSPYEDLIHVAYITKEDLMNLNLSPSDCWRVPSQFAYKRDGIAIFLLEKDEGFDMTIKSNNKDATKESIVDASTLTKHIARIFNTEDFGGHKDSSGVFIKTIVYTPISDILKKVRYAYKAAYYEVQSEK